jgi:hypothetical protein
MAKIPFGILGPIIGSIGPVTGKTWKNKGTLSAHRRAAKTDKNPTPKQFNQRGKFGFVSQFMGGLGPLAKKGFKELASGKTEFQCAVSYNVCNAVSGMHPDYILHYDRVALGRGTLPNAVLPEAKAGDAPGDIRFIWADNSGIGTAVAADKAIAVIYLSAEKTWAYTKQPDARRSDCSLVCSLGDYKGTVHTWLFFVSDNEKASDSAYTGELVLG